VLPNSCPGGEIHNCLQNNPGPHPAKSVLTHNQSIIPYQLPHLWELNDHPLLRPESHINTDWPVENEFPDYQILVNGQQYTHQWIGLLVDTVLVRQFSSLYQIE
jgi:hypothetical protein